MKHKDLTHQHRPMFMVKNGLFYAMCPKCDFLMKQIPEKIESVGVFYYSTETCTNCQKGD